MKQDENQVSGLQLDRIVFYGRTLSEYVQFFDLNLAEWQNRKILDCPSGAASFVAEACKMGIDAVAGDLLFNLDANTLISKGKTDVEHVIDRLASVAHLYNWEYYGDVEGLKTKRQTALQHFTQDYLIGREVGRYIPAQLPHLPFADQSFDLVLSGHFLFTYGQNLDYDFHLQTVLEFYRVCSQQVRIYPIQGINSQLSPYVPQLISDLKHTGINVEVVTVPWKFQKGSNQMLRLNRQK
ncbi:MAG TPA: class I SAM-dependent methyltransferase [Nostocaceae cyanobacterium]|nr:class I SAM-dependent methyltransferase [Nostocaceae cyanobacterium]